MAVPKPSRLDRIVGEIADELGKTADRPDVAPDYDGQISDREITEISVRGTIRLLRELVRAPLRGQRQRIVEDDLPAILKQIEGLQKAFKKSSPAALFLLFSGEDDVRSSKIPPTRTQQGVPRRIRQTIEMLKYLRARCQFLLAERPGEHGSADYRQRHVARETWRLLKLQGIEPAAGTADSAYGIVTSLLWEAVTGESDKDLQWACKAALQSAKAGELRVEGPVLGRGQITH